jgi:hypothetical protein
MCRSSKMESVELTVFQGDVIVLPHEDSLSLRVLVSIISSYLISLSCLSVDVVIAINMYDS